MEEQEIDWTNILKKRLNMKELTLDDFLMGIEKDFTDVDDDVPSEEPDLEDKMDDILNDFFNKFIGKGDDGFVTEDVMRKILDAMEKNKSNDIFIETLCESTIYMPISDSNRLKMLEQMKDVDNDNAKARVIATLSTDELKLDYMQQIQDDNAKANIISTLSTDELKLDYMQQIQDDNAKARVIATLSTDELKLDYMQQIQYEYAKEGIINTLSTDAAKIEGMKQIQDENIKARVIGTLSTDNAKIEGMKQIQDDNAKARVIATLSTDEAKMKAITEMKLIQDDNAKARVIATLSTDELKLDYMQQIQDDNAKANIISTLSTDEAKIEEMKQIQDDNAKARVIATLSTDELKLDYMQQIQDEYAKEGIINTLSTDEAKIEGMKQIQDDNAKAKVIATLSTDEAKIEGMKQIQDDNAKARVIAILSTDEAKIEEMKQIQDDNAKARVIATLSTDEAKIEEMKQIQDDNAKAEVIAALSTDEAKLKAISNIFSVPERYENTKKIKLPSDMTIGCEIESEGEKSGILYRLELFKWKGKGDGSLRNGIEMVSPIMHSDEQSVQGIYKICDLLKLMENSCSERCGGHIHIGADYLKDKQAYANLLSIYGNTEELLYIIANDPKDVTSRGTGYDSPLSKKVQNAIESGSINLESEQDVDSFIKSLEEIQGSRYSGLNFCSYDKHKTIEFRLPNGTINPNAWIENINLFGGIVKTAQDISIIQKKPVEDRSEDENKKMELFEKLQTEGLDDKSKLETLLELVIDKEDRDTYKNRYNENIKLLTDEQKEDIKNGTSSKPIKTKEIGKKVLTGSERVNIEEVEKCERVMQEIEKNNNLENTREEK